MFGVCHFCSESARRGRWAESRPQIWGGRVSLTMGLAAMALSASIGISLGVLSGYLGGHVDTVVMRVVDVMLAFPYILLAIVIVATLGPGLLNTMLAIGIAGIAFYVRVMRG